MTSERGRPARIVVSTNAQISGKGGRAARLRGRSRFGAAKARAPT